MVVAVRCGHSVSLNRSDIMKTKKNLQDAFAGESQANRKYLAFGQKAAKEGFPQVAKLFRAVAEAETIHAHSHLRVLDGVQGTAANLEAAIAGEAYEFTDMYPAFIADAEADGELRAMKSMKGAMEVEKVHHALFEAALAAVRNGQDISEADVHVCSICGHTVLGELPDRCPVCNAKQAAYSTVQ